MQHHLLQAQLWPTPFLHLGTEEHGLLKNQKKNLKMSTNLNKCIVKQMGSTNLCFARSDLVTELYFRWASLSASPHSLHSREVRVMLNLGDHRYLEGCSDLHIHKKPKICTDDDPCSAQFSYLPTQAPHYVLSPKASENIQPPFDQF